MEIEARVKHWGTSAGILLSKRDLEQAGIDIDDKVQVTVEKTDVLDEVRGALADVEPKTDKTTDELFAEFDAMESAH